MPWPAKPLIRKVCNYCFKEKWMKRAKARGFKYCSNKCKCEAKKNYTSKKRIDISQKHARTCSSFFCNRVRYYTDSALKRGRGHFCSRKCYYYSMTKQYKLDIKKTQEIKNDNRTRSIWKL